MQYSYNFGYITQFEAERRHDNNFILISNQFHEKICRQSLADIGKHLKVCCRTPRVFDDEQRVDRGEDFHGFG